jgi:hypothetical protein
MPFSSERLDSSRQRVVENLHREDRRIGPFSRMAAVTAVDDSDPNRLVHKATAVLKSFAKLP